MLARCFGLGRTRGGWGKVGDGRWRGGKRAKSIRGSQGPRRIEENKETVIKKRDFVLLFLVFVRPFLWFSHKCLALGPKYSWGRSLVRPPYRNPYTLFCLIPLIRNCMKFSDTKKDKYKNNINYQETHNFHMCT